MAQVICKTYVQIVITITKTRQATDNAVRQKAAD